MVLVCFSSSFGSHNILIQLLKFKPCGFYFSVALSEPLHFVVSPLCQLLLFECTSEYIFAKTISTIEKAIKIYNHLRGANNPKYSSFCFSVVVWRVFFISLQSQKSNFTRGVVRNDGFLGNHTTLASCHYFNGSQSSLSSHFPTGRRYLFRGGKIVVFNEISVSAWCLVPVKPIH